MNVRFMIYFQYASFYIGIGINSSRIASSLIRTNSIGNKKLGSAMYNFD